MVCKSPRPLRLKKAMFYEMTVRAHKFYSRPKEI